MKRITYSYYSKWLGREEILNDDFTGIQFIYSDERNKVQKGYCRAFDFYIFYQPHRIVVSYGDKVMKEAVMLKAEIGAGISIEALKELLHKTFGAAPEHYLKYVFHRLPELETEARPLNEADYGEYLDFFSENNPECRDTSWVQDYFADMVRNQSAYGLFVNGRLASCTDAPDMPYMPEAVQEIGINTRKAYRRRGYAADVCVACIKNILDKGRCPMWSTSVTNTASQRLAERVGFIRLADVLSFHV